MIDLTSQADNPLLALCSTVSKVLTGSGLGTWVFIKFGITPSCSLHPG